MKKQSMPKRISASSQPRPRKVISFRCPRCAQPFRGSLEEGARCACARRLSFEDSVFRVDDPQMLAGFRLADQETGRFLESCERHGWPRAFYTVLREHEKDAERFFQSALSEKRAAWKWLLPMTPDARILCIGVRQEHVPLSLACYGAEVVAVDRCRDRLRVLAAAAQAFHMGITCLESENLSELPFPEESFDAIVLADIQDTLRYFNGVSERTLPKHVLEFLRALLHKHGSLFIAGDNRFTYTGTAAQEASGESRRARRSSTSGNSYRGYYVKMQEAGFTPREVYAPIPNHRAAEEFVPLSGDGRSVKGARAGLSRYIKDRVAHHPQLLKAFGHSFALRVTKREEHSYSFLEELLLRVEWQLRISPLQLEHIGSNACETLVYCSSAEIPLLLRIPHSPRATPQTVRNAEFLKRLDQARTSSQVKELIPRWVHTCEQEGVVVVAETRPGGVRLAENLKEVKAGHRTEHFLSFLLGMSAIRGSSSQSVSPLMVEMLDSSLPKLIDPNLRTAFARFAEEIIAAVRESSLPGIMTHGQLSLGRIFWSPERQRISGVVDWHAALDRGLPGWDCLSLELSMVEASYGCSQGEAVLWLLEQGTAPGFEELWLRYADSLRISWNQRRVLLLSLWLMNTWRSLSQGYTPLHHAWIRRNIISVLHASSGI